MKKRLFSLFLSIIMLFSLSLNVFAEENHMTDVTYIGEGTEWYKLTVPAELSPGETGTVILEGCWPSDRKVVVTADETVDLQNDINDTIKTLDIEFNSIQQPGDNYNEIYTTEEISVADIENVLFGDWSGRFYYNVDWTDNDNENDNNALEPGLYDTNGIMLCSWEDSGIDVEQNYTSSNYKTAITSGYYVLTNNYPDTTKVVIPNSVTSIGNYTFRECVGLTSIVIPDSVTSIGIHALGVCRGLTSIVIPDSVTSIGSHAFSNCDSLTSIIIPDSVTSFDDTVFSHCRDLTSVVIGDGVPTIGQMTFQSCEKLTSVIIGDSVTSIGNQAFNNCSSLTSIDIPDSVTSIGQSAFGGCSSLTSVDLGNGVTSIAQGAFNNCTSLITINYKGGEDEWNVITKGENWDIKAGSNVGGYTVVYNYGSSEPVYTATFADNSWEDIIMACENNEVPETWSVGDTKSMTINSTEYNIQIIGKNYDIYTSGGTAPLTFQLVEIYATTAQMNSTERNSIGWSGSAMRTTTLPAIMATMPSEVQSAIKAVDKVTIEGKGKNFDAPTTLETTSDKLFLLSESEVFGSTSNSGGVSEGARYAFYANGGSTVKTGGSNWWFLRGPMYVNVFNFSTVKSDGNLSGSNVGATSGGISFAFCF